MPLEKKEDVGVVNNDGSFCRYCVNKDGSVKNAMQIFDGGVSFFMHAIQGTSLDLAQRLTRRNMKSLPYWKNKKETCLEGKEATDEEYTEAMKKLGE
jgi:hypothetical protein